MKQARVDGDPIAAVAAQKVLARQDRIPIWALPKWYLWVIGIGYFFTFFDIADIGYGMPAIAAEFHLTGSQSIFVALACGLVGYVVGSIVIGSISDRVGRYKILLLTIGITALGSFLDATSTGIVTLSIWRFLTGIGVGDRVDRRLLIFYSTVIWLIGMLVTGTLASVVVLTIGLFLASLALGLYLQVAYTYTAELFPTRARASGFALSDGIGHSGGVVGALLLPSVVASTTFFIGFAGIGVTGLIAGLIALLGPRTSRRRLEQVSR